MAWFEDLSTQELRTCGCQGEQTVQSVTQQVVVTQGGARDDTGGFSFRRLASVCKAPKQAARPAARLLASFHTRGGVWQAFAKPQNRLPDLLQGFWRVFTPAAEFGKRLQSPKTGCQTCCKASGEFSHPRRSLASVCKAPKQAARPAARLLASFHTRGGVWQAFAKPQNRLPDLLQGFWRVFTPAAEFGKRLQSPKTGCQTCCKASGEFSHPRRSLASVCKAPKQAARPAARLLASFHTRGGVWQAFAKPQNRLPDLLQGFWRVFTPAAEFGKRLQSPKTGCQTCCKASGEFSHPRRSLASVCKAPKQAARPAARLLASFHTRGGVWQAFAKPQNRLPDLLQGFWRVFTPAAEFGKRLQSPKTGCQTCCKASGEFSHPRRSLASVCKAPKQAARPAARLLASFHTRGGVWQAFAKPQNRLPDLLQGFWRVFTPAAEFGKRLQSPKTGCQTCCKASGEFSHPRRSLASVCKAPKQAARPAARLLASFHTRGGVWQAFAKPQNRLPDLLQGFWRVFTPAAEFGKRLQSPKTGCQTCCKASGEFSHPRRSLASVCKAPKQAARPAARLLASFHTRGGVWQAFAKPQNRLPDLLQGFWRVFTPAAEFGKRLQSPKTGCQTCCKASGEFSHPRRSLASVCKAPKQAARPAARLLASFHTRGGVWQAFAKPQNRLPDLLQGFWRVFTPAAEFGKRLQSPKTGCQTCCKASGEFSHPRRSLASVCKAPKQAARPAARLLASFHTRGGVWQAFAKPQNRLPDLLQGFWRVFTPAAEFGKRLQSPKTGCQTCCKASGEFSHPRRSLASVCKAPKQAARPAARLLASFHTRGGVWQAFAKPQNRLPDLLQGFWRVFTPAAEFGKRLQSPKTGCQTCCKASGEFSHPRRSLASVCKAPKQAARPAARLLASFHTRGGVWQAFAKPQNRLPDLLQGFWRVFTPAAEFGKRLQSPKTGCQTCCKASGEFSHPRRSLASVCKAPKQAARPAARLLASFHTRGGVWQAFAKPQNRLPDLLQGFWRVFTPAAEFGKRLQSPKTGCQTCCKASGEFSHPRRSLASVCKAPKQAARPAARLLASFHTRGGVWQAFAKPQNRLPDLLQGFWRVFTPAAEFGKRLQSPKTGCQTCCKASGEFSHPRRSLASVCKAPKQAARPAARLLASFHTRGGVWQAFAKPQNRLPDLLQGFWRVFTPAAEFGKRLQSPKTGCQTCCKASGEFSHPRRSLASVCKAPKQAARPAARLLASFHTRGGVWQAFAKPQNRLPDLLQGFWRVFTPAAEFGKRLQSPKTGCQTCCKASGEFSHPRRSLASVCKAPKQAARPAARLLASFHTRGGVWQAFAKPQNRLPDLLQGFWR